MTEQQAIARQQYGLGKSAFERGQYRQAVQHFEKAASLVGKISPFSGEVQIWLVTAYQARGQMEDAVSLCRRITHHPDYITAKQARRLLYILEAPKLKSRPEWMTSIPDLSQIEDGGGSNQGISRQQPPKRSRQPKPKPKPEPVDLSQVNTADNGFVWLGLGLTVLLAGSLAIVGLGG
ncbi:MAG: tetratricopeptide repeat protein [Elainellaceae cyanobacterium]